MRFFTTLHKAGRLEYIVVLALLSVATWWLFSVFLGIGLPTDFTQEGLETYGELILSAPNLPLYAVGMTVVLYLMFINAGRRLKDLKRGTMLAFLTFVPFINTSFLLYLAVPSGDNARTYTPYGDDPYDPNSWVPPAAPSATGTAFSYNGNDIQLPGEKEDDGFQQAA